MKRTSVKSLGCWTYIGMQNAKHHSHSKQDWKKKKRVMQAWQALYHLVIQSTFPKSDAAYKRNTLLSLAIVFSYLLVSSMWKHSLCACRCIGTLSFTLQNLIPGWRGGERNAGSYFRTMNEIAVEDAGRYEYSSSIAAITYSCAGMKLDQSLQGSINTGRALIKLKLRWNVSCRICGTRTHK